MTDAADSAALAADGPDPDSVVPALYVGLSTSSELSGLFAGMTAGPRPEPPRGELAPYKP